MSRLRPVEASEVEGVVGETLSNVPINIFKAMANNPAVMEGFLALNTAVGRSEELSGAEKEAVMLRTAERSECGYCVAAHTKIAEGHGVGADAALGYRNGTGSTDREKAILTFTDAVLNRRGTVGDADVQAFRNAGFGDAAIVEVCGLIAVMAFTNTFNSVNATVVDFPAVPEAAGR